MERKTALSQCISGRSSCGTPPSRPRTRSLWGRTRSMAACFSSAASSRTATQDRAQTFELSLQPIQFATLRPRGIRCASGRVAPRTPQKIRLFGVQREAAFTGGVVEDIWPVAHRQEGRMVLLTIRQFAVDEGGDERERGERLPVGRGIVRKSPRRHHHQGLSSSPPAPRNGS